MRAGIEPCHPAAHDLHLEFAGFKIEPVQVGDFQFAARGGLQSVRELHHIVVVEIETGDGEARLRLAGFLFNADRLAVAVELDHAIALRIVHRIGENECAALQLRGAAAVRAKTTGRRRCCRRESANRHRRR